MTISAPCKNAWDAGLEDFEEYQRIQCDPNYYKGKKYVISFISTIGTTARFIGCYESKGVKDISQIAIKADYPNYEAYDDNKLVYIDLQKTEIMKDLQNRLVIDWGQSTYQIVQYSKTAVASKEVKQITPKYDFTSYDDVSYNFSQLEEIVKNPVDFSEIHKALSAVNGVYVVLDKKTGKLYVGSAYGQDGILGRWRTYVNTNGTGGKDEEGNKKIIDLLKDYPDRYKYFQYSILEIIRRTGNIEKDKHAALNCEKSYKKKLGTIEFGLNAN